MPASDIKLSPELKALVNNALVTRHPMLMSYISDSGQPVLSFRGSTRHSAMINLRSGSETQTATS